MPLTALMPEYFVLLNSDVEVTPRWIEPVIAYLDAHPDVAACQPKIKDFYKCGRTLSTPGPLGGTWTFWDTLTAGEGLFDTCEEDTGQYDATVDVFWASGACFFIRSEAFRQAGGFDERFFAHMEEIDLCWRLINQGKRIVCCGDSEVYHVGGGTLHKSNPRKTFLNYRNNLLMLYKNLPRGRRLPVLLVRLIMDGISSVRFILAGAWPDVWQIVRAHFSFYWSIFGKIKYDRKTPYRASLYPRSVVWQYFAKGIRRFSDFP